MLRSWHSCERCAATLLAAGILAIANHGAVEGGCPTPYLNSVNAAPTVTEIHGHCHCLQGAPGLDGCCTPNTQAYGFYPTQWRRWPAAEVPTPTPAGNQGIIVPPPVELPKPLEETGTPSIQTVPTPEGEGPTPGLNPAPTGSNPAPMPPIDLKSPSDSSPGALPLPYPEGSAPSVLPQPTIEPRSFIETQPAAEIPKAPSETSSFRPAPAAVVQQHAKTFVSPPVVQKTPPVVIESRESAARTIWAPIAHGTPTRDNPLRESPVAANPLRDSSDTADSGQVNPLRAEPKTAAIAGNPLRGKTEDEAKTLSESRVVPAANWAPVISLPSGEKSHGNPLRTE